MAAKVRTLSKNCKSFVISRFFYRNFTKYREKNRILLLLLHYYLAKTRTCVPYTLKLVVHILRFVNFIIKTI